MLRHNRWQYKKKAIKRKRDRKRKKWNNYISKYHIFDSKTLLCMNKITAILNKINHIILHYGNRPALKKCCIVRTFFLEVRYEVGWNATEQ